MFGLIKKDLLMIKSNIKFLVILLFVYAVMAFQNKMDISFMISFMSVILMMSTFSYDAYNKWDAYAITLPNGRKNSVRAKYLATIFLIVVMTLFVTILSFIISYVNTKSLDIENILSNAFGSVLGTIIVQSLMYPTIYKFGVEKARIGIFIIVFGVIIISGIISNFIDLESITRVLNIINNYLLIIVPIVILIILFISYKVSESIYKKKEF